MIGQVVVVVTALLSAFLSGYGVWASARAKGVRSKPLWIAGSLFGFVGVGRVFGPEGELVFNVGIQIPVVVAYWGSGVFAMKAMVPIIAIVAIVKFDPAPMRARDASVFD
ncbi:hypothetical protein [Tsuneonella amylolytica]|uniref:hypothetical protein n=1 Tax=Tsuneonella amylolytica TaxID=2338327 RepID=UPI000EAAC8B9|nr:hypothetical protein [Tsuneonella amylolytica]